MSFGSPNLVDGRSFFAFIPVLFETSRLPCFYPRGLRLSRVYSLSRIALAPRLVTLAVSLLPFMRAGLTTTDRRLSPAAAPIELSWACFLRPFFLRWAGLQRLRRVLAKKSLNSWELFSARLQSCPQSVQQDFFLQILHESSFLRNSVNPSFLPVKFPRKQSGITSENVFFSQFLSLSRDYFLVCFFFFFFLPTHTPSTFFLGHHDDASVAAAAAAAASFLLPLGRKKVSRSLTHFSAPTRVRCMHWRKN